MGAIFIFLPTDEYKNLGKGCLRKRPFFEKVKLLVKTHLNMYQLAILKNKVSVTQ